MVVRNSFEKRQNLEREIQALQAAAVQLERDIAAAEEAKEPLHAKMEQLVRCILLWSLYTTANIFLCSRREISCRH